MDHGLSCLSHREERTRGNMRANKSLFQVLFTSCLSSDVTPPAVLPTLVPSLLEVRSQLA